MKFEAASTYHELPLRLVLFVLLKIEGKERDRHA